MNKSLYVLVSGIFSGLLIGLGGFVYLSAMNESKILASLLFAFGLFTIIMLNLHLFTGKIGYVTNNNARYAIDLLICLVGNALGSISFGLITNLVSQTCTRLDNIIFNAITLSNVKLNSSILMILFLSFMCGVMIFLAVELSKRDIHPLYKFIGIFLAVSIFILCNFEHCVADMFYFATAYSLNIKAILYLLLIIIGNSLGSIFTYYMVKFTTIKE